MSYQLADFKWGGSSLGSASGSVTVSANLNGLSFDRSQFAQQDFLDSLNKAFNAWENVSGIKFTPGTGESNIDIGVSRLAGSTIGLASISYSNRSGIDRINSADITFDAEETWSPNGEGGAQNFFAVALHEIGHAFGLGHIDDRSQIMNPVIASDDLGDGDIDGAQALYGKDPGDVDTSPNYDALDEDGPVDGAAEDEPENGPNPKNLGEDSEDDDGGFLSIILGGLMALVMGFLGVGGAVAGVALMAFKPDDEPIEIPEYEGTGTTLDDVLPTYEFADHGAGCGCGCQHDLTEDDDGNFTLTHELFA